MRSDKGHREGWGRALVTGASRGIGRAFAYELARRRCDLVLVSRGRDDLEELAADLSQRFGIRAEPLVADLTDPRALDTVEARLAGAERPIDLLVNNAGGESRHAPFLELDRDTLTSDAYLNAIVLLRLMHAGARAMSARDGGQILNVSAGVAFYPLPGAASYAASKAFVNSLSQALDYELRDTGVRVTAICPGFVRTGVQERLGLEVDGVPGPLWMEPEEVATRGLRAAHRGRSISSLNAVGSANAFLGRRVPRRILLPSLARGQRRLASP